LDKFIEEEEATRLAEEILSKLKIKGREVDPLVYTEKNKGDIYTKEVIFEKDYSQISYEGFDKDKNHLSIILSSYLNEDDSSGETYLSINIINKDAFSEINGIMGEIKLIFEEYNAVMDTSYCLLAKLEKQYSNKDINGKIYRLTKSLKGNIIDEYADDGMTSYTMYIPNIKEYIEIDKKKINLNIAIRYNEYENNTYLWIGTPIITTGY